MLVTPNIPLSGDFILDKIDKKYEPDLGKFKYDDELDLFLATKQHGSGGGVVSFIKKNWYIVAGAAAAAAVVISSTRK
jgi:hypothetical protein